MATYYEVLGVRPDSSHDEIKRSFVRSALQHHPDRQGEADQAARERAEHRMRELNAAWEVLGDPAARAAYDRDLRGGVATSAGSCGPGPGPDPGSSACVERQVFVRVEPTGVTAPTPDADRRGFWAGIGVIVVILGLAVAALVFTAYANDRQGEDLAGSGAGGSGEAYAENEGHERGAQTRTTAVLEVGSCIVLASVEARITPMLANCSMQGAYEVTKIVPLGSPCPADQVTFDLEADKQRLCLTSP